MSTDITTFQHNRDPLELTGQDPGRRNGRRPGPPRRQGAEHPPVLRQLLEELRSLGLRRRPSDAPCSTPDRRPLPRPPGRHWQVPRLDPAGPLRHIPLPPAAAGIEQNDNPARHPLIAEAFKGWRNQAPAPKQAAALTTDALARIREALRLPRRGRGGRIGVPGARQPARRPGPGHHRRTRRRRPPAPPRQQLSPGTTSSSGPTAPAASPSRRARTRSNRQQWP